MPQSYSRREFTELEHAVWEQDVEKVRQIVGIPYERIKRRRVETQPISREDDCLVSPFANAVNQCRLAQTRSEFQVAIEILEILLDNDVICWYDDPVLGHRFDGVFLVISWVPYPRLMDVLHTIFRHKWQWFNTRYLPFNMIRWDCKQVDVLELMIEHGLPRFGEDDFFDTAMDKFVPLEFFKVVARHVEPSVWSSCGDLDKLADDIVEGGGRREIAQYIRNLTTEKAIKSLSINLPKNLPVPAPFKDNECSVCYEKYTAGQKVVTLPCQHCFCFDCMMSVAKMKDCRCPYCRQAYL